MTDGLLPLASGVGLMRRRSPSHRSPGTAWLSKPPNNGFGWFFSSLSWVPYQWCTSMGYTNPKWYPDVGKRKLAFQKKLPGPRPKDANDPKEQVWPVRASSKAERYRAFAVAPGFLQQHEIEDRPYLFLFLLAGLAMRKWFGLVRFWFP